MKNKNDQKIRSSNKIYKDLKPDGKIGLIMAIIISILAVITGIFAVVDFIIDKYTHSQQVVTIREERLSSSYNNSSKLSEQSSNESSNMGIELVFDDQYVNRNIRGGLEVFLNNNTGKTTRIMESTISFDEIQYGVHYSVESVATLADKTLKVYIFNNGLAPTEKIHAQLYFVNGNRQTWDQENQSWVNFYDIYYSPEEVSNYSGSMEFETDTFAGGLIKEVFSIDLDEEKIRDVLDNTIATTGINVLLKIDGNLESHPYSNMEQDQTFSFGRLCFNENDDLILDPGGMGSAGDLYINYWLDVDNPIMTDYLIPQGQYPKIEDNEMINVCIIPSKSVYISYTVNLELENESLSTKSYKEFITVPLYGEAFPYADMPNVIAECMSQNGLQSIRIIQMKTSKSRWLLIHQNSFKWLKKVPQDRMGSNIIHTPISKLLTVILQISKLVCIANYV